MHPDALAVPARSAMPTLASTTQRLTRRLWPVIGVVAICALVLLHLLALRQGTRWTSPLLLGDHLFDLVLALIILWIGLALGRKVAAPLRDPADDPLTGALAELGIGVGTLSLAVLLAGFAHLYYPPVFVGAGILLCLWLRQELAAIWRATATGMVGWVRNGAQTAPTVGQRLLLLVLALTVVPLLVEATLPPGWGSPVEWDTPAYHLAAPKLYLEAHRFIPLPNVALANEPSAEEMLSLVGLAVGSEGLGKMLSLAFLVLLGLATFALARQIGGDQAGWLAVFLLFIVRWLGVEAPTAFPDFASFFCLVLGLVDALTWLDRRAATPPRAGSGAAWKAPLTADRLLVRAGMLTGIGVCCKLVSIPAIPALCLTVGLCALWIRAPRPWQRPALAVRAGAIVGLGALLVLSPWLLKNIYFFGRPFYGVAVQVSTPTTGSVGVSGAAQSTLVGHIQWMITNMADIAWHAISPLCILLPLAPFLLRRRSAWGALVFLLIGGVLWLTFVPRFIEPRYYVPLMAVGAALIGAVLSELIKRVPVRLGLVELPLVGYLGFSSLWVLNIVADQMLINRAPDYALGATSRDTYLAARVRPFPAIDWVNQHTPSGARVALLGITRGYYLNRPHRDDWYGETLATIEASAAARQAEVAAWCRSGVRYAILDRGDDRLDNDQTATLRPLHTFRWTQMPGLQPRVRFSANGVDVLSVTPCAVS